MPEKKRTASYISSLSCLLVRTVSKLVSGALDCLSIPKAILFGGVVWLAPGEEEVPGILNVSAGHMQVLSLETNPTKIQGLTTREFSRDPLICLIVGPCIKGLEGQVWQSRGFKSRHVPFSKNHSLGGYFGRLIEGHAQGRGGF